MNTDLMRIIGRKEWLIRTHERVLLVGLIAMLRPDTALEVGVWHGALTEHLAKYCKRVTCVDVKNIVDFTLPENVTFLMMQSDEAFTRFASAGERFDYVNVDADHSEENAYRDLSNAIMIGKVITMHDTHLPYARKGYERAIKENEGRILWGDIGFLLGLAEGKGCGIGLIITKDA